MKKLFLIVSLFVCSFTLRAETAAPLSAESQREFFKIVDEMSFAPYQRRKELNNELLRLGKAGNPCAFYCYATTLDSRNQCDRLIAEAFPQLLSWAEKGNWLACKYVSLCFYNGLGCEPDRATASRWLDKGQELMPQAVSAEDPLALLYAAKWALVEGDHDKVMSLLLKLKKHDSKFADHLLNMKKLSYADLSERLDSIFRKHLGTPYVEFDNGGKHYRAWTFEYKPGGRWFMILGDRGTTWKNNDKFSAELKKSERVVFSAPPPHGDRHGVTAACREIEYMLGFQLGAGRFSGSGIIHHFWVLDGKVVIDVCSLDDIAIIPLPSSDADNAKELENIDIYKLRKLQSVAI